MSPPTLMSSRPIRPPNEIVRPPAPTDLERARHLAARPLLVVDRLVPAMPAASCWKTSRWFVHEGRPLPCWAATAWARRRLYAPLPVPCAAARANIRSTARRSPTHGRTRSTGGASRWCRRAPAVRQPHGAGQSQDRDARGGASLDEVFALFPSSARCKRLRPRACRASESSDVGDRRALMGAGQGYLLDEPFEGLAPTIVKEVMTRGQAARAVAMVMSSITPAAAAGRWPMPGERTGRLREARQVAGR